MDITAQFAVLVPVVIGVVQVIKMLGLPSQAAPLLSLVLGTIGALYFFGGGAASVLQGLIIGLTASGLYSATKTTLGVS